MKDALIRLAFDLSRAAPSLSIVHQFEMRTIDERFPAMLRTAISEAL